MGLVRGGNQPVVCARFNAKNGFGAYDGIKASAFVFQRGDIVDDQPEHPACNDRFYSPFPELEKLN
jgi:hypothetical protein